MLGIASGAIAGLVAITPAAGYVGIGAALVIGVAASLACFGAVVGLKSWFGYDDSLDAFGIHAVGGIVGAVLTGVFASVAIGGVEGNIIAQLIGIGACAAYSLVVSLILLMLISVTIGLARQRRSGSRGPRRQHSRRERGVDVHESHQQHGRQTAARHQLWHAYLASTGQRFELAQFLKDPALEKQTLDSALASGDRN